MTNIEKEFYSQIGLLSIEFAKMEYRLFVIIAGLINAEEDTISLTLIEKNSLSQNIELLIKLNRIVSFHEIKIKHLLGKIDKVRSDRNLFIHGLWKIPTKTKVGIKIVCEERKLKYSEEKDKKGNLLSKKWSYNRHYEFYILDIKSRIKTIAEIIADEDLLIKALEENKYK